MAGTGFLPGRVRDFPCWRSCLFADDRMTSRPPAFIECLFACNFTAAAYAKRAVMTTCLPTWKSWRPGGEVGAICQHQHASETLAFPGGAK